MAANSNIEWTDHTFNPVRGCTKVSAGCAHCYAETMSKRNPKVLGIWGDNGTRVVASETMWREPRKWNVEAFRNHTRRRVFCASLSDVCEDRPEWVSPRLRLKELIEDTPYLDWQLLTKRPENYLRLFWKSNWPRNVWAGTSVENQEAADKRIPHLLRVHSCLQSRRPPPDSPLLTSADARIHPCSSSKTTDRALECRAGYRIRYGR